MNQILYSGKKNNTPTTLIASIAGVALLIVFLVGFAFINMFNNKILSGVYAADIDVSNMTKEEAAQAISRGYSKSLPKKITLSFEGKDIDVDTRDIGITYDDVDELAEKAYNYGREDNIFVNNFNVLMSFFNGEKRIEAEEILDENKLVKAVNNMIREENILMQEEAYKVSGDKLILTKVAESKKVDLDALKNRIIEVLGENKTYVEVPVISTEEDSLDIDLVYKLVHKEPINASYKEGENFEIISEQAGIDFDVDDAKKEYAKLSKGETIEIDLKVIEPEIKVADLGEALFKDIIATYSNKYTDASLNDIVNKLNENIIYPGEEFSFKKIMESEEVASGYTQMASILYNVALRADLKITERKANNVWVQYVPQSTDAIISDTADFKFENDKKYPIKIITSCADGVCTASIYSIKDKNDYDIEVETKILETINYTTNKQNDSTLTKGKTQVIQTPINGYVSEAYKVYYKDGEEVSRKLVSKDTYEAIEEIIKVGTKVVKQQTTTKQATQVQVPVSQTPQLDSNSQLPTGWDVPESGYLK